MSVHAIEYRQGAKVMRPIGTREEYLRLRGDARLKETLAKVRAGDEKAKARLPQMNYSCLPNEDGTLKGATRPSRSVGMDVDHLMPEELAALTDRILAKRAELGLLMLEKSARGAGLHVVFARHAEMTQEENLLWASDLLGVDFDKGAKDVTRVFYTTSDAAEDLLYVDDGLFDNSEPEVAECAVVQLCSSQAGGAAEGSEDAEKSAGSGSSEGSAEARAEFPTEYHGIGFEEIIRKYWELWNDGKEPMKGDRDTLTYQLACDLRHICGRNAEWLEAVIPCYDGFTPEERRRKIESALGAKSEGMPYRLKLVLRELKRGEALRACGGSEQVPPELPKRLPPLLRLLTSRVPVQYKAAVASAVFPSLATHLHGVRFRYWDNVEHEATLMHVLIGRQSVGKGSVRKPIEYITEEIRQRDIPNRQREAEWKQKNPGAKQKKDPRPTDICIQLLIDNLTDAVFNQRIVDANNNGERFVYTIVDEIDALKKVTSRGTVDEVGLLIRKAFDNSLAGQERVGADSVSGIAPLRWNFNASTTPPNARRFFAKMVNDGTVSRLDVSTIISDGESDELPVYGLYDGLFASELKPYLERLNAASGLVVCPQATRLAKELAQECAEAARLYDSEAYRVLSHRAIVIGWLKGMVLYVAQGYKWDKAVADFVRWSVQYNLWCKMLYFGQQLEAELKEEVEIQRQSGPQNQLELLPDEFNREQYQLMRQKQGKAGDGKNTLHSWMHRGYIYLDESSGRYCKTEKYQKRLKGRY